MRQINVTQKEQSYLKDALQMENLCIAKCSVYADQCTDQDLKNMMVSITKSKRQHADMIKQELGDFVSHYQQ